MAKQIVDTTGWLKLEQVMERTEASARSIDRMVAAGNIRKAYRTVANRRPIPVFCPEDVEVVASTRMNPTSVSEMVIERPVPPPEADDPGRGAALVRMPDAQPVMQALRGWLDTKASETKLATTYLTLEQAHTLTGLPKSYLLTLAQEGKVKAIRSGAWYFQRRALEEL
jgi:hypothetical protein